MVFQGEFNHTLDAKNRLFIPAKFREGLGEQFVVYPSPDGCLFCYTEEKWLEVAEQIEQCSGNTADRTMQRRLLRGVSTVTPDKQGRITLSGYHVERAALEKEVVVYGMTGRVEIWNVDRFNAEMGEISEVDLDALGVKF